MAVVNQPVRDAPMLRPVSAAWDPPFTILSYAVDGTASGAMSDMLTNYGLWQPSLAPNRHPGVVEAVLAPLVSTESVLMGAVCFLVLGGMRCLGLVVALCVGECQQEGTWLEHAIIAGD